jgi:hypothetical protein
MRCLQVGRSMVSTEQMTGLNFHVADTASHPAVEIALMLFRYLGLPFPADPVLAVLLRHTYPELILSLLVGKGGAARVGLMLPEPSTDLVTRLTDAAGGAGPQALALFETCLQVKGPAYLEYAQIASGDSLRLHYRI